MSETVQKSGVRAYIIETIMFLTYAFFAVSWIAGTTLTPQIMEHFNLTNFSSATFISNAITIAKIVGNLLAAWFLVKLRPKKAIAFASLLIVLGSGLGVFATEYWMFVVTRFIMGFGGALYIVYFGPIVIRYFDAKRRSTINGINAAAYNVGSIIAMVVVTPVFMWLASWQQSLLFFSACSLLLFVLWMFFGEDFEINKSTNSNEAVEDYTFKDGLKDKFNYVFPFTYAGLLLLYIVILTIFPVSDSAAIDPKTLSTIVAVAGVIGTVAGIMVSKKVTKRLPIIRWAGLAMTISATFMMMTSSGAVALIMAALVGFFMFLPMTALVTIPQELPNMTPTKLTLIMGFFWSFAYMFETVAYYFVGVLIDLSGFQAGLYCAILLSLSFFIGSFLLPETGKSKEIKEEMAS
ncbi:MFS transporter [Pontibacillus litoralis]|uniref:Major facilitator transporter n=1 Tax=Pontibacillus litoralis JSM 072002 TaxID=1385512 RepID=A0A0A5HSL2_9BACI|nr:MFS transporter [Pontibacillus litoralis]KGX86622.1 major facilitator transporter [Pontibacillus litoralis JSM 072002]